MMAGFLPAIVAVMAATRRWGPVALDQRGTLARLVAIFFGVWGGIALLVDWRRWWPGRRG